MLAAYTKIRVECSPGSASLLASELHEGSPNDVSMMMQSAEYTLGLLLVLGLVACGGSGSPPASAATCRHDGTLADADAPAPHGESGALPRYFTLELVGTETRVDDRPLRGHELSVRIDREAKDEANGGALVRLAPEFSGEILGAIVWELSTAGFSHIIVWKQTEGRPSEPSLSPPPEPVAAQAPPEPATTPSVEPPREVAAPPSAPQGVDVPPDASVRTIGLHVGGGPNDDVTRAKYIAPIEKYFDDLLRCHALAQKRDRNASVGVDLLIPARGGTATVKDVRTALSGEEFQRCLRSTLEKVQFPKGSRPTMISYSMLFEPTSDR